MKKQDQCGVYVWRNVTNGKCYVGSSKYIQRRRKEHERELMAGDHHSVKLQNAFNKYGSDNFSFEVLLLCPEDALLSIEQGFITSLDAVANGYNVAKVAGAPMRGRKMTSKSRMLMSAASKGKPKSASHAQNIGKGQKGRRFSPETRAKWSSRRKGRPVSAVQAHNLRKGHLSQGSPEAKARAAEQSRARWDQVGYREQYSERFREQYDETLKVYLQNPIHCECCGVVLMPNHPTIQYIKRLSKRKNCSRSCANRMRVAQEIGETL